MKVNKVRIGIRTDVENAFERASAVYNDYRLRNPPIKRGFISRLLEGENSTPDLAEYYRKDVEWFRELKTAAFWRHTEAQPSVFDETDNEYSLLSLALSAVCPEVKSPKGKLVVYQDCLYEVRGPYTKEQVKLLVQNHEEKQSRKFEMLKLKTQKDPLVRRKAGRVPIPQNVRFEVWNRDGGSCVKCGSRNNLEYDHIIPVSEGGSNTARNIELLCEACNRAKSNNIE